MDLAEALTPRNWHQVLEFRFAEANLTVLPLSGPRAPATVERSPTDEYLGDFRSPSSFEQLTHAIETSVPPESSARAGRVGVEVTSAAYRSIAAGGRCGGDSPPSRGRNPLVGASRLTVRQVLVRGGGKRGATSR